MVQMAERCNLSSLCISFCYKVSRSSMEVVISLLRASGNIVKFEAMGISLSPIGLEMLSSTSCLTHLCLCGVPAITDESLEMVNSQVISSTVGQILNFAGFLVLIGNFIIIVLDSSHITACSFLCVQEMNLNLNWPTAVHL